jgi:hypothetical protein
METLAWFAFLVLLAVSSGVMIYSFVQIVLVEALRSSKQKI